MNPQRATGDDRSMWSGNTNRRQLLTAGGLVALGGLSGCLGRAAAVATNTGASPAAMFGGIRDNRLLAATPGDTVRFTPTVRVEERFLSGAVELEAWMTNTSFTAKAQDYNSVRSNKRRSSIDGRPIEDEDDDSDGHLRRSIERLQSLTGATDDEIRAMYEYLDGDPVVREQTVITLPDARAPRGGPSVAELITPGRLIQFVTGRADTDGHVYAWGSRDGETLVAADEGDDEDETSESCEQRSSGGGLSTPDQLYCWGSSSATAISAPVHTYGDLDVLRSDAGIGIINSPPVATDETAVIEVSADGRLTAVDSLDEWGRGEGPASSTPTIVCQVLVQPPGCPCPFPALLHVQRHANNDQFVYSCGWIIDESCLYANSTTVLTAARGRGGGAGKPSLVDISISVERDLTGDTIRTMLPGDVSPVGSQLFEGSLSDAERAEVLHDTELAELVAETVSSGGNDIVCVCTPFDGACLHLVDDGETPTTVKFKAGAELSKSVN